MPEKVTPMSDERLEYWRERAASGATAVAELLREIDRLRGEREWRVKHIWFDGAVTYPDPSDRKTALAKIAANADVKLFLESRTKAGPWVREKEGA